MEPETVVRRLAKFMELCHARRELDSIWYNI